MHKIRSIQRIRDSSPIFLKIDPCFMVQTRSQYKKNMEAKKETPASSDLIQTNIEMKPIKSNNPLTISSSQNTQEENQGDDLTFGMSREEMTEMLQNSENHKIINIMMRLNPSLYMLELAKQGAKLPLDFYVSTIVET